MPDPNQVQSGQRVGGGRFLLRQQLGRGGMGEVWLARDERLEEPVALKFLPPEIRGNTSALHYLRTETARSHRLTHTHIVRIHDLHEDAGGPAFISMEYVEGLTLEALRLQQPGMVFSWEFLRPLLAQLCGALEYAHGEGVIHRDLKPSNVMLDRKGRLKLADFGIAAVVSDSVSRVSSQGPTSGTLLYMSPQQLTGKRPQVTDDLYALGATLYELLTTQPPFYTGDITHQVLHEAPEPLAERLAGLGIANAIPPDVSAMIMACLAKEPAQRPPSARAVAEWIGLELTRKPSVESLGEAMFPRTEPGLEISSAEQSAVAVPARAPGKRKLVLLMSAAVAMLLLAGSSVWYASRHPADGAKASGRPKVIPSNSSPTLDTASRPAAAGAPQALKTDQQDLERGLVLYYSFDERPRNGLVRDQSGTGNDGQVVGARWTPEGHRGGGFQFGLATNYIRVPNNDSLNPAQVTLAAWIKTSYMDKDRIWRRIFDKGTAEGYVLSMCADYNGKSFEGQVDIEPGKTFATSGIRVADGRWHHVVGTFDGTDARIYVDGRSVGRPGHWIGKIPWTAYDLTIGANRSNPGPGEVDASFNGLMDDLMIFIRSLSPDEVRQLYEFTGSQSSAAAQRVAEDGKAQAEAEAKRLTEEKRLAEEKAAAAGAREQVPTPPADDKAGEEVRRRLALATRARPWVNSLEMPFVPVPGTRALFCVWDTRVKDYAAYAAASGGADESWKNPGFEQGDTHPVVKVAWDDAKTFCRWLTEKERREGRISKEHSYRLPTDAEWSVGVGLNEPSGGTPGSKNFKTADVYPWGNQWPPPREAGNYAPSLKVDNYQNTSPVGSFAPNRFGLYDMGGNVWQWCEDFHNGQSGNHVERGGSWVTFTRARLLSSCRLDYATDPRDPSTGFRCVLAAASSP